MLSLSVSYWSGTGDISETVLQKNGNRYSAQFYFISNIKSEVQNELGGFPKHIPFIPFLKLKKKSTEQEQQQKNKSKTKQKKTLARFHVLTPATLTLVEATSCHSVGDHFPKPTTQFFPGIGLYSFATSRGYIWGPMFLQYSNNNDSLPSLGKLKVWGQKHYCEAQLLPHPADAALYLKG